MSSTKNANRYPAYVLALIMGLIAVEGGYVNHPSDPGGETNFGITKETAQQHGYAAPIKEMPKEVAVDIYATSYIYKPKYDEILKLSIPVGTKVIDAGVNTGIGRASRWYQQSLNAYSRGCRDYPCIAVDGSIGSGTIQAHKNLIKVRGGKLSCVLLLRAMDTYQGAHYLSLNSLNAFTVGWMSNRIGNVEVGDCG